MKKSLCFLSVLILLFTSCSNNDWENSIITNKSEYQVTFKFNKTEEFQIKKGETVEFKTTAYQRIQNYSPEKRVYFSYDATNTGYTGEFNTRQSWTVRVNNTIGEKAVLTADDWMDEMTDILPGNADDDNHTGKIYTKTPLFSVKTVSGFPAYAVFNKTETETDIIFYVTIQWTP
ncbi:MAG: hypothetical protein FWB73_07325 [Treponema sp.]|nr:hypothetical protein [Treponema sp.]